MISGTMPTFNASASSRYLTLVASSAIYSYVFSGTAGVGSTG